MKFLAVLLTFSSAIFAQQKITGTIFDKNNDQPIPFVSIGIIGKSVGTISNELGIFEFQFSENQKKDSIKIATIGYKPKIFLLSDFIKEPNRKITLESLPVQLTEVTVRSKKVKFKTLGTTKYTKNNCTGFADIEGNWKGSEAAILIKNKKNCLLEDFSFFIIQNKYSDSLVFRLNFYGRISPPAGSPAWFGEDWVGPTILKKAIVFKVGIKQGEFTLPLKNYNIQTNDDFFISLECLMDEMEISKFCYSGTGSTPSFFKVKAFAKWHKTGGRSGGGGADFNVKVSYTD
ncbi:MAG: carboxypeptidase-like regulatory domain-containing protein [Bacteroidetes bacterium]|nr:carboxypeptidase-like regulatory domain-containing protein [Bacteroidota bacterium]